MRYWLASISFLLSCAVSVVGAGPAGATSSWACAQNSDYGSVCQKIFGSGLRVTDIGAVYTEANNYLSGKKWRFETTRYACDPRGRSKSTCPPDQTHYGPTRSGSPAANGQTCVSAGISSTFTIVIQQCQSFGVQLVYASNGDLGYGVPFTIGAARWYCDEIQVYNATTLKWVDNGAGTPHGIRACNQVH